MGARHSDTAANHTDLQSGCGQTCVFAVQAWSNLWNLIWLRTSHYSMVLAEIWKKVKLKGFHSTVFSSNFANAHNIVIQFCKWRNAHVVSWLDVRYVFQVSGLEDVTMQMMYGKPILTIIIPFLRGYSLIARHIYCLLLTIYYTYYLLYTTYYLLSTTYYLLPISTIYCLLVLSTNTIYYLLLTNY